MTKIFSNKVSCSKSTNKVKDLHSKSPDTKEKGEKKQTRKWKEHPKLAERLIL